MTPRDRARSPTAASGASRPGGLAVSDALVRSLRAELAARADPERAPAMQRYMKSDLPFLGVPSPAVAVAVRTSLARHPIADADDLQRTVRVLFEQATHREEWYAALGLLRRPSLTRLLPPQSVELIAWLTVRGAWWDVTDSAAKPLGSLLATHRARVEPVIRSWIDGDELWLRRLAIICQLGRRGDTDLALLTDAIEGAQDEREFFLRKAIGWALRQHSKTDEPWVRQFLADHPRLSTLSRREALAWLARRPHGSGQGPVSA